MANCPVLVSTRKTEGIPGTGDLQGYHQEKWVTLVLGPAVSAALSALGISSLILKTQGGAYKKLLLKSVLNWVIGSPSTIGILRKVRAVCSRCRAFCELGGIGSKFCDLQSCFLLYKKCGHIFGA